MKKLAISETPKILAPWFIYLKRDMAHVRLQNFAASHRNGHAERYGQGLFIGLFPLSSPVQHEEAHP
jgi:hypothetical protein